MKKQITFEDSPVIIVVGGGPAGAFFAIQMLKKARDSGKSVNITIIEKKKGLQSYPASASITYNKECNYCAGGISPRLVDALERTGIVLPDRIIQNKVASLIVQGHWKNIELRVPDQRKMYSVFRGTRLQGENNKHTNFDSYLLARAVELGVNVVTAEVYDIKYSSNNKPVVSYRLENDTNNQDESKEADFVVLAGGVNHTLGKKLETLQLFKSLRKLNPNFSPPKVRKALIFELEVLDRFASFQEREIHFVEYGSKHLKIEMSSLIPKGRFITVVLLGRSIDRSKLSDSLEIIKKFIELPHIRRILPQNIKLKPACVCNPNMTVRAARNPSEHRIAIIGDMVISRLYKDGIYSAYLTASALVDTMMDVGIDSRSLRKNFLPTIKMFTRDNWYGRCIFLLHQITFSSPVLSRILYQAILTERKTKPRRKRRLAKILWNIASGDDSYRNSLISMFYPITIWSIFTDGLLITIRNYLTELVFGLKWQGFGRYPTGLHKEDFEFKRQEFFCVLNLHQLKQRNDFESMYSIKIKADRWKIISQVGKLGDSDMEYFKPRMIKIKRIGGFANEVGCLIQYNLPFSFLSFSLMLKKIVAEKYLIYRVTTGFPRDGILVFNIDEIEDGIFQLYIYVAFNFPHKKNLLKKLFWYCFKIFFPGFAHDVLWNHSLCKLKDIIETD